MAGEEWNHRDAVKNVDDFASDRDDWCPAAFITFWSSIKDERRCCNLLLISPTSLSLIKDQHLSWTSTRFSAWINSVYFIQDHFGSLSGSLKFVVQCLAQGSLSEPGTLCFSAQVPTDWATTVITIRLRLFARSKMKSGWPEKLGSPIQIIEPFCRVGTKMFGFYHKMRNLKKRKGKCSWADLFLLYLWVK